MVKPIAALAIDLIVMAGIFVVSAASGFRLLKRLGLDPPSSLERWVFGSLIGFFLLSYGTLLLGYLGLLFPITYFTIFIGLLILGWPAYLLLKPNTLQVKPILWLFVFAAFCNLIFNHVPATEVDELAYHLGLPALYARSHFIVNRPDNWCSYYPLTGEMLFTLGMVFRGVGLARLWCWLFALLASAGVYSLTRRLIGKREVAETASLLYYLFPLTSVLSGSAYPDQFMVFAGLMALCSIHQWSLDESKPGWLYLGALCAAISLATRYTGMSLVVISGGWVLWYWVKDKQIPFGRLTIFLLKSAGVALLVLSPWLIRSLIHTGNPFYPRGLIPGLPSDDFFKLWFQTWGRHSDISGWSAMLGIPKMLTMGHSTLTWGPLPLAFVPLLFVLARPFSQSTKFLLLSLLAALSVTYLFLVPHPRYFVFSFPFVAILSACGVHAFWQLSHGLIKAVLIVFLAIASFFPYLGLPVYFAVKRLPLYLGRMDSESYIAQKMAYTGEGYSIMKYVNENLPEEAVVFVLGIGFGPQLYYPNHRILGMDAYPLSFYSESLPEVLERFKKDNVGYLVFVEEMFINDRIFTHYLPRFPVEVPWFTEGIREGFFELQFRAPKRRLYKINYPLEDFR